MLELLFDTPWWLPTTILGIGAFVAYTGNQRLEKKVVRSGLAIILAGLLVMLISYLVETNRERAIRRTREVVAAVHKRDWQALQGGIDPQTNFYGLRGPTEITSSAQTAAERSQVTSARIISERVDVASTVINVRIRVASEAFGRWVTTDWQFQYQNLGQGWILYNIVALSNEFISEERIRSALNRL